MGVRRVVDVLFYYGVCLFVFFFNCVEKVKNVIKLFDVVNEFIFLDDILLILK